MNKEPNCHKCQYLTHEYDNNDCEYTFLYGCLYSVIDCVTTDQLQKISDCHYVNPERKVRSFKLIPEEEYDNYLRWKNNKDEHIGWKRL